MIFKKKTKLEKVQLFLILHTVVNSFTNSLKTFKSTSYIQIKLKIKFNNFYNVISTLK